MKNPFAKIPLEVVVATLAALAILLAAIWLFRGKPETGVDPPKSQASNDTLHFAAGAEQLSYLDIAPVEELAAPTMQALPGKLAFDEDVTVRVFSPVTGRVTELVAKPGMSVKAKDVLAWINSPDFAQARADARKAQADLAMKQKALSRTKELTDLGVLARKDFESAQADLGQAQAELDRAQSVLKNLDPTGSDARYALRAPIAGIVVDRTINPGQEVRPDAPAPLFILTDPSRLWANFELSEQDMAKVHNGQAIRIDADAVADTHFAGRIIYVGAALDPATRRISVRALVERPDPRLKPEMFARISPLEDDGHKEIAVPDSALVSLGLHHYVFVEEAPGTLKRREVQLGVIGERVAWVKAGVRAGERVVTRGAVLLNAELGQAE
ncbi:MAG: efflux RND transporter periplasmic adaptor subunit [Proteobacteria bacterium]|uniref:efflux RND transporter periplasmic adaptor subunit n=1 Tax=Rudaea sp. TaxID=2136325 RepID=UPI00322064F8|nr:efflux RND transporter periplasmic adaptor subunit [Pseudomonadota bacterium]